MNETIHYGDHMYKIVKNEQLSKNEYDFWIEAPRIATKAQPGQFVILRINEIGERIPLTIADADPSSGLIRLIFQVIGKTTAELSSLCANDSILDLTGPLGTPTEIKNYGTVMIVGGGVGIAAIFPIIKGLKQAGNRVITILGAKTSELVILQKECQQYSDELIITTDDGSLGMKGLVTEAMEQVIAKESIDCSWAIGPSMMMKFCTMTAENHKLPIYVSLNPIMIDGTGMCGGCRVTIDGSIKFACVDGPEFKGTQVNWDEFISRMKQYTDEEEASLTDYQKAQVIHHG
ncbi:ferredoxin-NADP(+) reductase subunit alpha [Enterococcus sp. 7F3_DIV0205]|uniref:Ferredoxin-NADP(+) reductase subunit alpha n=2 Tax=Candidatus Enterococcus palustris TaxID=1834189 RepID=A0AAQ3W612_9ENTE|nr:ferredoxin-NADP(+) reductase subunit alpha [Enterococcus sp. 7F3_DIV0205]